MAGTLELEVPDFDQIRLEAGSTTESALRLIWSLLNTEMSNRRVGVRQAQETITGKVLAHSAAAALNNFDTTRASVVHLTGASAQDITGFRNGKEGRIFWVHNTGSGTQTVKHENTGSTAGNRIVTGAAGDVAIATGETVGFIYLSSRWREINDA